MGGTNWKRWLIAAGVTPLVIGVAYDQGRDGPEQGVSGLFSLEQSAPASNAATPVESTDQLAVVNRETPETFVDAARFAGGADNDRAPLAAATARTSERRDDDEAEAEPLTPAQLARMSPQIQRLAQRGGATRVPLIVRSPRSIEAGSVRSEPTSGVDFFATAADFALTGESAPDSLQSWWRPRDLPERELVWHFPYYHPERKYLELPEEIGIADGVVSQTRPSSAIRKGRYKLHLFHEDERVELYDLATDVGEQRELSEQMPDVAKDLTRRLRRYLRKAGARWPVSNR